MKTETKKSGPITHGLWDTRTRSNSYWCDGCKKWLRRTKFVPEELHRTKYCPGLKQT